MNDQLATMATRFGFKAVPGKQAMTSASQRDRVVYWLALLSFGLMPVAGLADEEVTQSEKPGPAAVSVADQRIAFLREKMERIRLRSVASPTTMFPLHDKLALRWSNPVSGVVD